MSPKYLVGVVDDSGGFWLGFSFLIMMGTRNNVPNNLGSEFQLSTLKLKVQITLMSSKSLVGVVEDTGGSWLGFLFLIMMRTGTQCPKQPMFKNSAFYVEFEGAKNPHVLEVLGWSCGGLWRFLTWVLVPDNDWDGSTMSQTTDDPKSASYIEFKGAKNPHVL